MLEAQSVSYEAGSFSILKDVNLSVRPGEFVALVGPNGAGKSTLLKLMSGSGPRPSAGTVLVDGVSVSAMHSRTLARRRAFQAQSQSLQASFPAYDVVLMGRSPHVEGKEKPQDHRIASLALDAVDAMELADRSYAVLSGGERQRIAFARTQAQIWEPDPDGPRYLLLDEPTNNLDLSHQHHSLRRAGSWAASGVGVIAVLHDLNLAAQYAARIVVMHEGRIVADGRPREVLTDELLRRVFRTVARIEDHPCLDCPLVVALHADVPAHTEHRAHTTHHSRQRSIQ